MLRCLRICLRFESRGEGTFGGGAACARAPPGGSPQLILSHKGETIRYLMILIKFNIKLLFWIN